MLLLRVFGGAVAQAVGQLTSNKVRSFLSLLGITIGIFCIIGVKAAVNSIEDNIRGSFERLGNDVVYISKMPWGGDPGENYWKYQRRPQPSYNDFENIERKVKSAKMASYNVFIGSKTIKYENNNVQNVFVIAATYNYAEILKIKFEDGRYFSPTEYNYGADAVVIGSNVAKLLFGAITPIGKEIYFSGRKLKVVGVIEATGRDVINPINFDDAAIIPYTCASKFINLKSTKIGSTLNVKAQDGVSLDELTDEVTGVLRSARRLKPVEENDFAVNQMSIIMNLLNNIFDVLNLAGFIIGGFALLVGMFSVANIMFVSVKERTNLIGIKKAIGAKKSVILLEFLIESIILCVLGGAIGLLAIFSVTWILSIFLDFDIYLSFQNALTGVLVSVIVGVIAGMIPALQASNMDPVEAMRK